MDDGLLSLSIILNALHETPQHYSSFQRFFSVFLIIKKIVTFEFGNKKKNQNRVVVQN